MSALQKLSSIYVFTHDSIAVGEDGPTHEPIEQLSGLRSIPNLNVFRPCDYNETIACYKYAINSKTTPSVLVLTRQNLKSVTSSNVYEGVRNGAYIVCEDDSPSQLIMASGSEVKLAIDAKQILNDKGINVRIVSIVCFDIFDKQDDEYKNSIFGSIDYSNRFFIEMSSGYEGYKYACNVIGINKFGMSAPASKIINAYGFSAEEIAKKVFKNEL
jgi:transketolase